MKKDLEVVGFRGPNTILVGVRIPERLHEQLVEEAKERGETIPDLVRKAISLSVFPGALSRQVSEGIEIVEGTDSPVDGLREYYADLSALIKESEAAVRKAKAMQQTIRLIEKKVEPIFKKVFGQKMKKWQLEQQQHEQEARIRKKHRDAAGYPRPSAPNKLSESQKAALTPEQKKHRDLI